MKIYVEEKSIKAIGDVSGPSGEMNASKYIDLYWDSNFVELMKNGKHGDAVGQNKYMFSEILKYLGKDDPEHDIVKSHLPDEHKKLADKTITRKTFEKQPYWEYKAMNGSNKAPVKLNATMKGLQQAGYKEATDSNRCAICWWYRGTAQLCLRYWVSVNPDFTCLKFVQFPSAGELKIAKPAKANAAAAFDAADFLENRALLHLYAGKREVKDPAKATSIQVGYEEGWIEPNQIPKLTPFIDKKYGGTWKFDHVDHFGAMGIGAAWFKRAVATKGKKSKTNKATSQEIEYKCFYTGKPVTITELIEVDKLMESLAELVGDENYEEFLDALGAMRKDPKIPSKAPYVHKFKGKGDIVINVCKKVYNDALSLYESNDDNDAKASKKPKTFRIVQTYDIVTPESAKTGEFAESEFEDEEGIEYPNTKQGIEDAADHIKSEGATFYDRWFSTEPQQDYQTGEERTDNFHVHVGKSDARDSIQEKIIADKIAARLGLKLQHASKSKAAPAKASKVTSIAKMLARKTTFKDMGVDSRGAVRVWMSIPPEHEQHVDKYLKMDMKGNTQRMADLVVKAGYKAELQALIKKRGFKVGNILGIGKVSAQPATYVLGIVPLTGHLTKKNKK